VLTWILNRSAEPAKLAAPSPCSSNHSKVVRLLLSLAVLGASVVAAAANATPRDERSQHLYFNKGGWIQRVTADGTDTQIVASLRGVKDPIVLAWTRHGDRALAIIGQKLIIVDQSGKSRLLRTNRTNLLLDADWSPDGRKISVVQQRLSAPAASPMIFEGSPSHLTFAATGVDPTWFPNGINIVYQAVSPAGLGAVKQVNLRTHRQDVLLTGLVRDPALAPDGKRIAYIDHSGDLVVAEVNSPTDATTLVAAAGTPVDGIEWSLDSRRIAFRRSVGECCVTYDVYVILVRSGSVRRVARRVTDMPAVWGP
jgi:Tol biopolymer transport system component